MPEPTISELRDLVALGLVPGIGPRLTAALLQEFGSATAVLQASPQELARVPHIGDKLARDMVEAIRKLNVSQELDLISKHQVKLLALGQSGYPAALQELGDAPPLLYVRGELRPEDAKAVAIVGSRHCTSYGKRQAERLATGLAQRGYTIISGLARGIDGVAHRGALAAGGRTIAVLAGGLAKIYPPEHDELAREVETRGALLTESGMSMQPLAGMFPARNRLISALSLGVIIVEAADKSGALITARHAAEQGRPAFALPGPVDSAASAGTNRLIRQGAILVRHAEDVLEELEGIAAAQSAAPVARPLPADLNDNQRAIWASLAEQARHVDELARQLGLPVHVLTGELMVLEMRRLIRRLPGNHYERS
ncbi:MAG: DNA-processing protein DprA [Gemmataceae bacterium]